MEDPSLVDDTRVVCCHKCQIVVELSKGRFEFLVRLDIPLPAISQTESFLSHLLLVLHEPNIGFTLVHIKFNRTKKDVSFGIIIFSLFFHLWNIIFQVIPYGAVEAAKASTKKP